METDHAPQAVEPRRGMSPAWIATGAITLLVLGLLGYALTGRSVEQLQPGSPVPDFQLTALDGSPMNLADYQGQVIVVNFFASWCAPCRQEAAGLEQTWRQYQPQGVQFLGIAYKDAGSKAQAFLEEFGVSYPSGVDPGNRTAHVYGVTGVPETFVVDRAGLLVQHAVGPITQEQLGQTIDRALGQ